MSVKKWNAHVNAVIAMIVNVTVRIAIVMKLVIVVAKMDILANARNKVDLCLLFLFEFIGYYTNKENRKIEKNKDK